MQVTNDSVITDDGVILPISFLESERAFNQPLFGAAARTGRVHFDNINGLTIDGVYKFDKQLRYRSKLDVTLYYQYFESTGTFTVPSGVTSIYAIVCAAGGSDGNDFSSTSNDGTVTNRAGGNGGVGGMSFGTLTVTPLSNITATIGAAGANVNGGNSTFSSMYATGGVKGANATSGANGATGADGTGGGGNLYNGDIRDWIPVFQTYLRHRISTSFDSNLMYAKVSQSLSSPTSPTPWEFLGTRRPGSAGASEGVGGAVIVFWSV